jgi:hypothetical protein
MTDGNEVYQGITKDDVWGEFTGIDDPRGTHVKISKGMITAQGIPYEPDSPEGKALSKKIGAPAVCPMTKAPLPFKSVNVVCKKEDQQAVEYWLEYVHGGGCVEFTVAVEGDRVLIRSNYMAW